MHGSAGDRRALEREALRNVIAQWNANRLDLFELSEPNEELEFHGVMRFYFQDSGQKVATKCIRVASDATVEDVIGTLIEKFRPDMRMLSVPSYALYELHENCSERRMAPDEKPLLVQLNWHVDDREGRFLLKNIDEKTNSAINSHESNASFRRKLSKREKKQLKKQEKLQRMKSENGKKNDDGVAEKLYSELPETSFTRSISNPEAVMRRRRQQKLERKLQQFRSKDGGPDTGGTLKIYGEALCRDVPYKTLLLSIRDSAGAVVREMLDKYGLHKADPSQWCLVQATSSQGTPESEYVLDDDECPLSILMTSPNTSSIMFHVRRRPADGALRKRKKKPGTLGATSNTRDPRSAHSAPVLVELGPDGSTPHLGDTARTLRLANDVMEVGSANGIALQLYGPHIQPRHAVIANTDGLTSVTPCHADAHIYVNGQRIHQTTILTHGTLIKFGHSNTYRFLDPSQEGRQRHPSLVDSTSIYDRSPRALSPSEPQRENFETTFDIEGNVETVSTASGAREDNRSLGSSNENRLSGMDRYPRGQDPILPAVLEFPEDPQEQFLARVITHLDVTTPTFRLAPAYTLYLCARYRASTHYRPELTPTERAHKLTLLLQHAAMLVRHTIQDRSTENSSQAFWLANASELLHFLKSDRHVSAFSLQAQDTLADSVQHSFRNLVACCTEELSSVLGNLTEDSVEDQPREIMNTLSAVMNLLRKCRVNAGLTIQLFSQLFHWISAKSLSAIIGNPMLCTKSFGMRLFNRLRNLQVWAESQGLELAAECNLTKIIQCAHLLQAPKQTAEELSNLSATCFKLNSLQLRALLTQYKPEPGEIMAPTQLLEQTARAAENVTDELARAEGREVRLHDDPAPPLQLLLPDDGFSCDVVQGVPAGLADFLQPLQASGLCRLAAQPTSSGHWTVYMNAPRPPSALSNTQPEVQVIRLHKTSGGMGLSIVAAKGAGQERLGIYIKSVVPGGPADRDGRLAAGDQLLSVDGQSLLGITQEKAADFLVRTGSVVTLEVAKGGAVYHGLATLLQQPSPTPHRAWEAIDRFEGSQESLYNRPRIFTPPIRKPKRNVFFNSDDSLYKSEMQKLTIPQITILQAPEFKLEITDFSEPNPKSVTIQNKNSPLVRQQKIDTTEYRDENNEKKIEFSQKKSISVDDPFDLSYTENHLNVCGRKLNQCKLSNSLQELSSSTSSINSGIHDSTLDLTQIDPNTPVKRWKSPDDLREGKVKTLAQHFEHVFNSKRNKLGSYSVPDINKTFYLSNLNVRSFSNENLHLNDKLTEYERMEVLKVLCDWSLQGCEANSDANFSLKIMKEFRTLEEKVTTVKKAKKSLSESNLSPRNDRNHIKKYTSETNLGSKQFSDDSFLHDCIFTNCIFNRNFDPSKGTTLGLRQERDNAGEVQPKSILKNSNEHLYNVDSFNNNVVNKKKPHFLDQYSRRHSDINLPKPFNSRLMRCGSIERIIRPQRKFKKFPESYIVTRNGAYFQKGVITRPKVIVTHKKCLPKNWKSCSDIKSKQKTVKKCCRNAKRTCPVLANSTMPVGRKTKSSISIDQDDMDSTTLKQFDRPRRMSERDLPSRVDQERTIPSSKSVPALHHISPNSEQSRVGGSHDMFNPGYSRTSSNNSINTTSAPVASQNGPVNNQPNMRSRSTHNLLQQDTGFYQNLSIYRNKMPSPQQLGDRASALRSSQNSLQSSVANSQRPVSAYYPQNTVPVTRPSNLHQSIPNLKSPPSVQRLHNMEESRSGSYPSVNQHQQQSVAQHYPNTIPNYLNNTNPNYAGQPQPLQMYGQPYGGGAPNNYPSPTYPQAHEEIVNKYPHLNHQRIGEVNSFTNSNPNSPNYMGSVQHINGPKPEETIKQDARFSGGLLREDLSRQPHPNKNEEMMRYPVANNVQIQHSRIIENEMRTSRSDDMLRQHTLHQNEIHRYASSGNIRIQDVPQYDRKDLRSQAKLAEMGEEVKRRQNRVLSPSHQPYPPNFYPQHHPQQQQNYHPQIVQNNQLVQNTHNLQNLHLTQTPPNYYHPQGPNYPQYPNSQPNTPTSPTYPKSPPLAPKPMRKIEDPPELPPTATHPLYTASMQDPPKMAFYPNSGHSNNKGPARDPWQREEQERQAEVRREQARQWQDQQIKELLSLPHRSSQQDEQLRVLQLEKEFQRRALEAEQDEDETEEKDTSATASNAPQVATPTATPIIINKQEPPSSILKPGVVNSPPQQPAEPEIAPPPPERGSSYVIMSLHNKEGTKRVTFNDASAVTPPSSLPIEENIREDPNSFIRQAESMLASPTTPTDGSAGLSSATPGVIGAQEFYRDPRTRRLAEQAQQKQQTTAVPEKLSFKEKMKMFAMETGEHGTPKDKSKISRAQRDIDNIGSPNSNLVH